jgi:hypothetical protein
MNKTIIFLCLIVATASAVTYPQLLDDENDHEFHEHLNLATEVLLESAAADEEHTSIREEHEHHKHAIAAEQPAQHEDMMDSVAPPALSDEDKEAQKKVPADSVYHTHDGESVDMDRKSSASFMKHVEAVSHEAATAHKSHLSAATMKHQMEEAKRSDETECETECLGGSKLQEMANGCNCEEFFNKRYNLESATAFLQTREKSPFKVHEVGAAKIKGANPLKGTALEGADMELLQESQRSYARGNAHTHGADLDQNWSSFIEEHSSESAKVKKDNEFERMKFVNKRHMQEQKIQDDALKRMMDFDRNRA